MFKKRFELLTDGQWSLIEPLLPEPKRRKDNRGRPWATNRACLEGILWVLRTSAAWRFLPDKYPSPATCWRRLKQWEEEDVWPDAWRKLRRYKRRWIVERTNAWLGQFRRLLVRHEHLLTTYQAFFYLACL
jgi:transposase